MSETTAELVAWLRTKAGRIRQQAGLTRVNDRYELLMDEANNLSAVADRLERMEAACESALLLLDDRGLGGSDELGDFYASRVDEEAEKLRVALGRPTQAGESQ